MNSSERFLVYPCLFVLGGLTLARQETRPSQLGEATFQKVTIVDEKGKPVILLDGAKGHVPFEVFGPRRQGSVALGFSDDGGGVFKTYGPDGKERVELGATEGGVGSVRTFGPDGRKRVELGAMEKGGGGSVEVMGPTGTEI